MADPQGRLPRASACVVSLARPALSCSVLTVDEFHKFLLEEQLDNFTREQTLKLIKALNADESSENLTVRMRALTQYACVA